MNLAVRARAFLATLGLACVIGLAAGTVLEIRLRAGLVAGIEEDLDRATRVLEAHLASQPSPLSGDDFDAAVDRIAAPTDLRLTVVAPDGEVLGESTRDGDALSEMDDHSTRPEVTEAQETPRGVARRFSKTVNTDLLYVARSTTLPDGTAVILRAGRPLSEIDDAVWALRLNLLLSALIALAAALISAAVVSRWMQSTLERLVVRARALSGGAPPAEEAPPAGVSRVPVAELSRRLEAAVQDLAAERDRREAVLAGVTDAVIAVDHDLVITLVNPAAAELLGPGVVGRCLDVSERAPDLETYARAGLKSDAPVQAEIIWKGPPDKELEVVVAPLHARDGAVLVLHDLTELRSLERVRRDFVANVSHELRTPVAIISATTETLVDGAIDDPEMARPFTNAVHRHAVRLGALVDDLLSLSRIEAGRQPMDPAALDLRAVARHQAALAMESAPDRSPVTLDIDEDLQVFADRPALDHALGNLIANAIKYVPPDAAITVRAGREGPRVWIDVMDEGPGISDEHAARVFERFYRVDSGRSREVGGTGLGLSIVRHLANAMGGSVHLRANEPHGCIFRLDLPAADGDAPATG